MAKTDGLGAAITVDDASSDAQTISNDITNFTLNTTRALQDITGIDKSAHERLGLLADASLALNGVFNPASNMSHAVLSSVTSSTNTRAVTVQPTSSDDPVLDLNTLFQDYNVTRSNTGELTWTATAQLSDGTVPSWTNS